MQHHWMYGNSGSVDYGMRECKACGRRLHVSLMHDQGDCPAPPAPAPKGDDLSHRADAADS